MDGNKDDIPGHFREIFSEIYNSANDKEDLIQVLNDVESKISVTSLDDVDLVTADIVKQASKT